MSNKLGKSGKRFSPLEVDAALRIVASHFNSVNAACLDEIARTLGRRPTRQVVRKWVAKAERARMNKGHMGLTDGISPMEKTQVKSTNWR
jgi:hypothetical protein